MFLFEQLLAASQKCTVYSCDTTLKKNECLEWSKVANSSIYNAKIHFPCTNSSTPRCENTIADHSTSMCKPNAKEQNYTRIAGVGCSNNWQCASEVCDGTCQGNKTDQTCGTRGSGACAIGFYCNSTKFCTAQLDENKVCSSDYDCKNNLGCLKVKAGVSTGICFKYMSIDDGKASPDAKFCKNLKVSSGNCTQLSVAADQCKNKTVGASCKGNYTNLAEAKKAATGVCMCGSGKANTTYCNLLDTSSDTWKNGVSAINGMYTSNSAVHTLRRAAFTDSTKYFNYLRISAYPAYEDAADCYKNWVSYIAPTSAGYLSIKILLIALLGFFLM